MKHMAGVPRTPEEAEATPKKRHVLFDHPILTEIVMFVLFAVLANGIVMALYAAGLTFEGMTKQLVTTGVAIVAAILVTLFFQLRFRKEFDGMFGWSSFGLVLALPALLFVMSNLFSIDTMQFTFLNPEVTVNPIGISLFMAMAPGISEELLFRGIPASNWMRTAKDEGTVIKCVIITSVLFGLVHGVNALAGAAITATLFQVFYATCLGLLFCTIFLRTGSIWPTIIVHTLIDFSGFLFMNMDQMGIITEELIIGPDFYAAVGISVALIVFTIIMLRGSKREEIMELWHRKWNKTDFTW